MRRLSLTKVFFIITNFLLYVIYVILFCKASSDKSSESMVSSFSENVGCLTGASFLILAVSILKHGSQLESTITNAIRINSNLQIQLDGLDLRILSITITISLIFLCRTLVDFMIAMNLLDQTKETLELSLSTIFFSEVLIPSAVVYFMLKKSHLNESTTTVSHVGNPQDLLLPNHYEDKLTPHDKADLENSNHTTQHQTNDLSHSDRKQSVS